MFKVLLVDDREVFLRTVKRMPFFHLYEKEIQIQWAVRSAESALAILRRDHVDLVMTDIRMPMMSGIELLKIIRKEKLCACTILMSEYTDFAYAREGILYGAFDYIVKPLEEGTFSDAMERALSFLRSSEMERSEDMITADELEELLFRSSEEVFARKLEMAEAQICSEKNREERSSIIRKTGRNLLQALTMKYPFLELYFPMRELLGAEIPDPGGTASEQGDARAAGADAERDPALDRLKTGLWFLRRKAGLFHTDSPNIQVQNIWYYTISSADGTCRLTDTADRFFLNPSYLSTLFKKETGTSYKNFVLALKMERARYLLAYSDLKVAEVAAKLSFTDTEYFRKMFKAHTGVPPGKFDYEEYVRRTAAGEGRFSQESVL